MVQNKQQTEKEPSFIRGLNAFAGKDVTAMSSAERLVFMTYIQQYKEARGLDNLAHDPQISPALKEKIEYAVKKYREDEKQYVSVGQRDLELAIQREQQMQYMSEKEFQNFMREFEDEVRKLNDLTKQHEEVTKRLVIAENELVTRCSKDLSKAKTPADRKKVYAKYTGAAMSNGMSREEATMWVQKIENKAAEKEGRPPKNIAEQLEGSSDSKLIEAAGKLSNTASAVIKECVKLGGKQKELKQEIDERTKKINMLLSGKGMTPQQIDELNDLCKKIMNDPDISPEVKAKIEKAREDHPQYQIIKAASNASLALNQYEASSEAAISLHNQKTRTASSPDESPNVGEVGTVFNGGKTKGNNPLPRAVTPTEDSIKQRAEKGIAEVEERKRQDGEVLLHNLLNMDAAYLEYYLSKKLTDQERRLIMEAMITLTDEEWNNSLGQYDLAYQVLMKETEYSLDKEVLFIRDVLKQERDKSLDLTSAYTTKADGTLDLNKLPVMSLDESTSLTMQYDKMPLASTDEATPFTLKDPTEILGRDVSGLSQPSALGGLDFSSAITMDARKDPFLEEKKKYLLAEKSKRSVEQLASKSTIPAESMGEIVDLVLEYRAGRITKADFKNQSSLLGRDESAKTALEYATLLEKEAKGELTNREELRLSFIRDKGDPIFLRVEKELNEREEKDGGIKDVVNKKGLAPQADANATMPEMMDTVDGVGGVVTPEVDGEVASLIPASMDEQVVETNPLTATSLEGEDTVENPDFKPSEQTSAVAETTVVDTPENAPEEKKEVANNAQLDTSSSVTLGGTSDVGYVVDDLSLGDGVTVVSQYPYGAMAQNTLNLNANNITGVQDKMPLTMNGLRGERNG